MDVNISFKTCITFSCVTVRSEVLRFSQERCIDSLPFSMISKAYKCCSDPGTLERKVSRVDGSGNTLVAAVVIVEYWG